MARPPQPPGRTRTPAWPVATLAVACAALFPVAPKGVRAALAATAPPSPAAPAPGWTTAHWSTRDGLPVDAVNDVLEARNGYLWLATFDGLLRFDGASFERFDQSTTAALTSNRILALRETPDGTLWALTQSGEVSWFAPGGAGRLDLGRAPTPAVSVLYLDHAGTLWVGAHDGVWRVDGRRAVPFARAEFTDPVNVLCRDRAGALWVGGPNGAARIGPGAGASAPNVVHFAPPTPDAPAVTALYELADGRVLVGARGGLYAAVGDRLAPVGAAELVAHPQGVSAFHGLLADSTQSGALAALAARGDREPEPTYLRGLKPCAVDAEGAAWNADDGLLIRNGQPALSFPSEITRLSVGRDGLLWVATGASGFYRVARGRVAAVADTVAGEENGLYGLAIGPDGTLWMAGFRHGLGWWRDGRVGGFAADSPYATTVAVTRAGRVLVGTYMTGLYEAQGDKLVPLAQDVLGPNRIISAILEDRAGDLWIGTDAGVYRESNGAWTHYDESNGLPNRRVRTCLERKDGSLWFGTNGGGIAIWRDGHWETLDAARGLPTNLVRGMLEDERGVVWVASEGRGLVRIELGPGMPIAAARVHTFGRVDGVFDETLHTVLEDARHALWISSNRGIFRVSREALEQRAAGGEPVRCRVFDDGNGMPSREANGGVQNAGVVAPDGQLWFATQAGAVVIDPRQVGPPEAPPPVVIEDANSELTALPLATGSVRIGPDERDLAVRFAALSYVNPHATRFRYRLVGYDDDWIDAGDRREAFYSRLAPRRYRFEVESATSDGPWSGRPAAMTIVAAPHAWETWWFRALLALLVTALGFALYRARMHGLAARERALGVEVAQRTATIERQALRLRELDEAKTRFFADVSHEFRTPLTLTIGPLEDLLGGEHGGLSPGVSEQLEMALRNSRRALRQVNRLLDLAKLEGGAMRIAAAPGDAVARVRDMVATFRPQAERKGIAVTTRWPIVAPHVYFDAQLFEQAVANLLSNAVKFTPEGGTIHVEARTEAGEPAGWFAVTVRDTGPGIPEADQRHVFERFHQLAGARSPLSPGTGIGLSLTREIVELHGGRIDVASQVGAGSAFTIRLKLGHAHLSSEMIAPAGEVDEAGSLPAWLLADATPRRRAATEGDEDDAMPLPEDAQTVLLVEDDEDVRAYLHGLLAPHFRVIEAVDGDAGLATARRTPPDCIVSDVMMPGMDGDALCRALRRDPDLDWIPILLLTARASTEHRLEGLAIGADDYLAKPFHARELLLRVRNLIASRQRLRDRLKSIALKPHPVAATAADDVFLAQVRLAIEERMGDETFTVPALADAIGYERTRLYRRLKDVSGATPEALIREFRLERASQLLTARAGSVSEIAYAVGFKSVTHFCKVFRDKYGVTPGSVSARTQTA